MGWELRHGGGWYLYRNRRVNGKPVKEYLAAGADPLGFGALMAHELARLQKRSARLRRLTREGRAGYRTRIDHLLADVVRANTDLRVLADGLLATLGYRKHNRGEWRMRRDLLQLKSAIAELEKRAAEAKPLINYQAPVGDSEAVELFTKARAGDADAQARVSVLVRQRNWTDWIGALGRQATRQLICRASGGDPVWEAGITEKANALRRELLGDKPTVLEELLVRRVVNGWLAVHALELEQTVRAPLDAVGREHLDKALTRAQKRFAEAARELARVRRLQAPLILAQLNVAAAQTVVNAAVATASIAVPAGPT